MGLYENRQFLFSSIVFFLFFNIFIMKASLFSICENFVNGFINDVFKIRKQANLKTFKLSLRLRIL